jgi:hypothetical protein
VATKARTVAPAEQFEALLPKITTRELYGVAVAVLCEGAARADNYAGAVLVSESPREIAEEGLAFVARFKDLWGFGFGFRRGSEAANAVSVLRDAERELKEAWEDAEYVPDPDCVCPRCGDEYTSPEKRKSHETSCLGTIEEAS